MKELILREKRRKDITYYIYSKLSHFIKNSYLNNIVKENKLILY